MSGFSRGVAKQPERPQRRSGPPPCRPCQAGNCERCPTAITRHGQGSFSSSFECPHYDEDPIDHQQAVENADARWNEEHGRDADDVRTTNRWDSKGGVFDEDFW